MSELVTTDDGSVTLFHAETGELYHNRAGAFTEALRSYTRPSNALRKLAETGEISLLDACFGLGYNTFVLLQAALDANIAGTINVSAIELDPTILRFVDPVLQLPNFVTLNQCWKQSAPLAFGAYSGGSTNLSFHIELVQADLRAHIQQVSPGFDFIFHDPFSPRRVPELWTVEIFQQYRRILKEGGGAVLTYAAAGAIRNALLAADFGIYKTAPVGRKQGGTLGSTKPLVPLPPDVHALSDDDCRKVNGLSGVPYRDPTLNATRAEILAVRQIEQASLPII